MEYKLVIYYATLGPVGTVDSPSVRDDGTEQLVARTLADLAGDQGDWVSRRSLCVAVVSRFEIDPETVWTALRQLRVDGRIEQKGDSLRIVNGGNGESHEDS